MTRPTLLLSYLEQTVERLPDKAAFVQGTDALTFAELSNEARAIGTALAQKGYARQAVVIFMKRHPRAIVGFLGTLYAGCYYVPIDEEVPDYRIEMIFRSLKPAVLLCDTSTRAQAEGLAAFEGELLVYEDLIRTPADQPLLQAIREQAIDTDPAYIVFTSGSTGTPKGVVACHRSVIDYIEAFSEVMRFTQETVFGMQAPLSVDACLKEIYPTLKFGATTHIIPKEQFLFPVKLVEYLNTYKINTICWVVPALTLISGLGVFDQLLPRHLHTIASGSEAFPIKQFILWQQALPQARFINLYGPTEATGMSCWYEADRLFEAGDVLPIGKPFRNTRILLLDDQDQAAAAGQPGEICILGTSLTLGYYGDFEQTRSVFVQNPLNHVYPELLYRTGDLGRYNERGELVFLTRKDDQIKHMGHRIELAEIELVVNQIDGVIQACALFDEGRKRIVLYYTGTCDKATLAGAARQKLPRYMVPSRFEKLDTMPLTNNGKLDRMALKKRLANTQRSKT